MANWWDPYRNSEGFKEALAKFGLTIGGMDQNPTTANSRANNQNDPLYWLKRTLEIYREMDQGVFYIPLTETAKNTKKRMSLDLIHAGRSSYFPTNIFVKSGEEITISVGEVNVSSTDCYAGISDALILAEQANRLSDEEVKNLSEEDPNISGKIRLAEKKANNYRSERSGQLMLSYTLSSRDMKEVGKQKIRISVSGGEKYPIFIFGMHTQKNWREYISKGTKDNVVRVFSGRDNMRIPSKESAAASNVDIGLLAARYLIMNSVYERVNGFDSSNDLNRPTQTLLTATWETCCYSALNIVAVGTVTSGNEGLLAPLLVSGDKIGLVAEHEYGHQHTMGWSWEGQIETTTNIYPLIIESYLYGKKDDWPYYKIYSRLVPGNTDQRLDYFNNPSNGTGKPWDPEAVPNFIKSGAQHHYDEMSKETTIEKIHVDNCKPPKLPLVFK